MWLKMPECLICILYEVCVERGQRYLAFVIIKLFNVFVLGYNKGYKSCVKSSKRKKLHHYDIARSGISSHELDPS